MIAKIRASRNVNRAVNELREGTHNEFHHNHSPRGHTRVEPRKDQIEPDPPPLTPSERAAAEAAAAAAAAQQAAPQHTVSNNNGGTSQQQGYTPQQGHPRTLYSPHNTRDLNATPQQHYNYTNSPPVLQQDEAYQQPRIDEPTTYGENAGYYLDPQAGTQQPRHESYDMPTSSPPQAESPVPLNRRNRALSDSRGADLGLCNQAPGTSYDFFDQNASDASRGQADPYYQPQAFQQHPVAADYLQDPSLPRPEHHRNYASDPAPQIPAFSFPQQNGSNLANAGYGGQYGSDFGSESSAPSQGLYRSHTVAGHGFSTYQGPSPGMCPRCGKMTDGPWHCEDCGHFAL